MKILGIDPSLNNFGYCIARYSMETDRLSYEQVFNVASPPLKNAKQIRKNCQDLTRARVHARAIAERIGDIDMVMAEVPVGSQSARAMASYGMCIGLLSWIEVPMIEVSPMEVKLRSVGKKTATKEEMIAWAYNKNPHMSWKIIKGKLAGTNEHMADAVATINAGVETEEFKSILAAARFMGRASHGS